MNMELSMNNTLDTASLHVEGLLHLKLFLQNTEE